MSEFSIAEWCSCFDEDMLLADGFEDAFIGVAERCGQPTLAVYDVDKCIAILMERDGMEYAGAEECFAFNTLGAWMGEHTPLYLRRWPGGRNGG